MGRALLATTLAALALNACAASGKLAPAQSLNAAAAPAVKPGFQAVDFDGAAGPLGDMLRGFAEANSGGVVLMSGLEERAAPEVTLRRVAYEDAIAQFAAAIDCDYFSSPHYYMIVPDEYASLQDLQLAQGLDNRYATMRVAAAFGAKTPLYTVFSVLSGSLGITIVADNFLAELRCGELALAEAPLGAVIEAVLQSARIPPDGVVAESSSEFIFLRAARNVGPTSMLIASALPDAETQAVMERVVSLSLPHAAIVNQPQGAFLSEPIPLHEALTPLTEQLGVEIVARRRLADSPINPCVMTGIRLGTALDLLIRQWPLAEFGYEVQPNRILIRER